jgi:serine/threonine-protein kinase SRPK3
MGIGVSGMPPKASTCSYLIFQKIFELATNEPLFPLGTFGLTAEEGDQEHIRLISQLLDKECSSRDIFTKYLMDRLPPDFGAENIQRLASFLWSMLRPDPQTRMSTTELLKHPFLIGERT